MSVAAQATQAAQGDIWEEVLRTVEEVVETAYQWGYPTGGRTIGGWRAAFTHQLGSRLGEGWTTMRCTWQGWRIIATYRPDRGVEVTIKTELKLAFPTNISFVRYYGWVIGDVERFEQALASASTLPEALKTLVAGLQQELDIPAAAAKYWSTSLSYTTSYLLNLPDSHPFKILPYPVQHIAVALGKVLEAAKGKAVAQAFPEAGLRVEGGSVVVEKGLVWGWGRFFRSPVRVEALDDVMKVAYWLWADLPTTRRKRNILKWVVNSYMQVVEQLTLSAST